MLPKSTCKGCEKREVGCHATCEDYISFREELNKMHDEIDKARKRVYPEYLEKKKKRSYYRVPTKKLIDNKSD